MTGCSAPTPTVAFFNNVWVSLAIHAGLVALYVLPNRARP